MKRLLSFIVCALVILTQCVILANATSQSVKTQRPAYAILNEEDKRVKGIDPKAEKGKTLKIDSDKGNVTSKSKQQIENKRKQSK